MICHIHRWVAVVPKSFHFAIIQLTADRDCFWGKKFHELTCPCNAGIILQQHTGIQRANHFSQMFVKADHMAVWFYRPVQWFENTQIQRWRGLAQYVYSKVPFELLDTPRFNQYVFCLHLLFENVLWVTSVSAHSVMSLSVSHRDLWEFCSAIHSTHLHPLVKMLQTKTRPVLVWCLRFNCHHTNWKF